MNNLAQRSISAVVFTIVMVFGIIWDRLIFSGLFLLILLLALREFYNISLSGSFKLQQSMGIVCAAVAFLASAATEFWFEASLWMVRAAYCVSFLILVLIPVSCIFRENNYDHGNLAFIYAGLLYIALPVILLPKIMMDGEVFDGWMLLSFFIIIWLSDVGAYFLGTAFGQKPDSKKLAPKISPKKSWWGFWSAVVFGIATSVGLHFLTWLPFSLVHCMILGLIISVGGVCGDLVESMWKRHFGVKDSGNCIPGHGGMLDRFDSALVAIPLACIYLSLFGLI
ncbi:MAG: phosphatidate cytidylyltransferase [Bacteroidales bacterium]|nr:phosphatidate cytidylyltransferase [Bacteroidales bacterium]